jgi:hypothetical protein
MVIDRGFGCLGVAKTGNGKCEFARIAVDLLFDDGRFLMTTFEL